MSMASDEPDEIDAETIKFRGDTPEDDLILHLVDFDCDLWRDDDDVAYFCDGSRVKESNLRDPEMCRAFAYAGLRFMEIIVPKEDPRP